MRNGGLYDLEMSPGPHTCYSNDRQAGAAFTAEAGKDYYLRTDIVNTAISKAHFRLMLVPLEQGEYEIKGLARVDRKSK